MAMAEKLILRNFQSPGDIVMLTPAVRDPQATHPERACRRSLSGVVDRPRHAAVLQRRSRPRASAESGSDIARYTAAQSSPGTTQLPTFVA